MFEAATSHFVDVVGRDTLQPPPSLEAAIHCKPLSLVVKQQPKWPWQTPVLEPQPFKLTEVLLRDRPVTEKEDKLPVLRLETKQMTEFRNDISLTVKGKLGFEIANTFNLELEGSNTINVHVNFGVVKRTDVDVPTLAEALTGVYLDADNAFVKWWRKKKKKQTLCLIVGVFFTATDSRLTVTTQRSATEKAGISLPNMPVLSLGEEVSKEDNHFNYLLVPAFTTIAYKVCEFNVTVNGALELSTFGSPVLQSEVDGSVNAKGTTSVETSGKGNEVLFGHRSHCEMLELRKIYERLMSLQVTEDVWIYSEKQIDYYHTRKFENQVKALSVALLLLNKL
ncbi:pejvakin-like [Saccoglossus kowalevskii]|uniref:Pejvakin-like n=1 Tax=Saccoglossus kowalevskii TaxID=10224 RepID=A0ABM0GZG7_SACKO|nr:PREDICTED: pejvakin-like [Saccoglossus kowalevskii]